MSLSGFSPPVNGQAQPPPATGREQGAIVVAPRPVRRYYIQGIARWDAWAPGIGWGPCIACHLDGAPITIEGVPVEGVNPHHLDILMAERFPESERCVNVDGVWRAI